MCVCPETFSVCLDGRQPAGVHRVSFNENGLPSGIYNYRLQVEISFETKRMVVVR